MADLDELMDTKLVRPDVFDTMRSARAEFEIKAPESSKGSFGGLLLVSIGTGLVVLAFIFVIKSLWLSTHPSFNLSLPKLPNLSAINAGQFGNGIKTPPGSKPVQNVETAPVAKGYSASVITDFVSQVAAKGNVLADSTPKQALVDMGVQICSGLNKNFTKDEIISDFVLKINTQFPKIVDVESFAKTIFDSASLTLCYKGDPNLAPTTK